jgi:hypothetical protein
MEPFLTIVIMSGDPLLLEGEVYDRRCLRRRRYDRARRSARLFLLPQAALRLRQSALEIGLLAAAAMGTWALGLYALCESWLGWRTGVLSVFAP